MPPWCAWGFSKIRCIFFGRRGYIGPPYLGKLPCANCSGVRDEGYYYADVVAFVVSGGGEERRCESV